MIFGKNKGRKVERAIGIYGFYTLKLTALVVAADMEFGKEEKEYVGAYMQKRYGRKKGAIAFKYLDSLLHETISLEETCARIREMASGEARLTLMYFLFGVAASDDLIHPGEKKLIGQIAEMLEIGISDYNSLCAMYFHENEKINESKIDRKQDGEIEKSLKILGLQPPASVADIKKAWRELAKKHHPDKVIHLGEEHTNAAQEKFRKIRAAYEILVKAYGS